MSTELVKVDPKEFGLEEVQVTTIEQAFLPKIAERDGYAQIYEVLITKELTKELCNEAGDLRRKLVKTRTGIADIHKTQKAFFLSAGRFVDAWKNKETLPIEQMEEKLSEIEKHFERIEVARIMKLESDRLELTKQFTEYPASGLGLMADVVFESYLLGLKVAYEAKIKAEQEAESLRIENEKIDKLGRQRITELYKYAQFQNDIVSVISMGSMSYENYKSMLDSLEAKKVTYEAEQERIRFENEKLKAEAIAKEKEQESERKKQADELSKQKAESDEKARIEKVRQDAILAEIEAKAKIERDKAVAERNRLESELKAKQEAERKVKEENAWKEAERIAAEINNAKAPDKEKLAKMVDLIVISIPDLKDSNAIAAANVINAKFEAFKIWAKSHIQSV